MGVPAFKYKFDVSLTNQDADTAETTAAGFVTTSPPGYTPETDNEYVDTGETGRITFLAQDAPIEISKRWGPKTLSLLGTHDALTTLTYWASHGDGAATSTAISAGSFYMNAWTDDTVGTAPKCFTFYDLQNPGVSDDNNNTIAFACVMTNVTITGARDQLIGVNATVLGGGKTTVAGTGSASLLRGAPPFSFSSHCGLFTSGTLGPAATGTPFTDATIDNTKDGLNATADDFSDDWHGFTLSIDTGYNLAESIIPGGTGYVAKSADWIMDSHSVTLTLRMRQGTTNTNTLLSEYQAKTARAFSIVMIHPTQLAANAFAGFRAVLSNCYPIPGSYSEEVLGDMGQRIVTLQYRAHNDSGGDDVRFAGTLGASSQALGG